jgi:glycosyltransferase involved in cell wall biosynthesis
MKRHKLAVLTAHPIQYQAPLFRRLASHPEIDLTVYFCWDFGVEKEEYEPGFGKKIKWDIPLLEGYKYKFLPNLSPKPSASFWGQVNPAIIKELRENQYDAIWIHGYSQISNWLALASARLSGTAVFYRCESSLVFDSNVHRHIFVRLIKPCLLRFLFKQVNCFLSIGTLNKQFYLHYGVQPEQIYHVPYAVDNEYFVRKTSEFHQYRHSIRAGLGINPDNIVFLFAAKMIPKKAPIELLQAYKRLSDLSNKGLIMVGDGELRPQAEAYVRDNRLCAVHFVGFVNQSELPKYYAISDVFIRPDGLYKGDWGLTVNEAMASRLGIIATDKIGVTTDLVRNNENGIVVRFGDIDELASAMRYMILNPETCRQMGKRSSEIISTWGYEECVNGILKALHSLTEGGMVR